VIFLPSCPRSKREFSHVEFFKEGEALCHVPPLSDLGLWWGFPLSPSQHPPSVHVAGLSEKLMSALAHSPQS